MTKYKNLFIHLFLFNLFIFYSSLKSFLSKCFNFNVWTDVFLINKFKL